jgi:hypothetical protein
LAVVTHTHTHTQAKWSVAQIHTVHDTNLPASALTPFSSVAKVMRDPEGRGLMLLANSPHSLQQQQQRSTTSSSSLQPLLQPIASPSFVEHCQLALLEASCRAEADDSNSNSNWSSTAVTESHASNPPQQPRMPRGTTLAERWMSL